MRITGKAKRLDDIDLPAIGAEIDVGEDEIHAVLDVETAGGGFDSIGRPKMLFEPHIFYRELGPGPARDKAVALGLAYPKWGQKKYPKDSYARLGQAMEIDLEKALRSASWGLGQIMGFNCKLAGYATARQMVDAFLDDEETHLRAMVKFIINSGLHDELRGHDWAGFARGYNGAGYAKHGYHTKLAAAFKRWQGIPDTPYKRQAARQIPATAASQEFPPPEVLKPTSGAGAKKWTVAGAIAAILAAIAAWVTNGGTP